MKITHKEIQKSKRRILREEKETIERKLHPSPVINGLDIFHEHRGQMIEFRAYKDGMFFNNKSLEYLRIDVLYSAGDNFYKEHKENFDILVSDDS